MYGAAKSFLRAAAFPSQAQAPNSSDANKMSKSRAPCDSLPGTRRCDYEKKLPRG